jgi:putative oxidoreductase
MTQAKSIDIGILVLRIGIGLMFILHGWPKIAGGVETWKNLGGSMALLGIGFAPAFWGFMAAFAEFAGGLLLIFGLVVRPASFFLLFTMFVATLVKINGAQSGEAPVGVIGSIKAAAHPLSLAFVFLSLIFLGPGLYSLSAKIKGLAGKWYS